MFDDRYRNPRDQQADFDQLVFSNNLGSKEDPENPGTVFYRGLAGPGTVEYTYDSDTHEVVNGRLREIDFLA